MRSATYKINCMVFCESSDLVFAQMFHPREWAQCEISQLSRTPLVTAGTRALQPRKGSQWKSLDNQSERKREDVLAIKWLHSRQGRYQKTSGSRKKEGGEQAGYFEKYSPTALSFFNLSVFYPMMVAHCLMLPKALVTEEMSTMECIDFIQTRELLQNKKVDKKGGSGG